MYHDLEHKIFGAAPHEFEKLALELFQYQYANNPLYKHYTDLLRPGGPGAIRSLLQIPFLPVSFFKTHTIATSGFVPEVIFESSGTSQTINSRHHVKKYSLYRQSFLTAFEQFYGLPREWCIIGLLPSYLERGNSSLVAMVNDLIQESGHAESGFYLYELDKLHEVLLGLEARGQKTLLIGVTYALLDFADRYPMPLMHTTIMETGGMKGRRREMTRPEVHGLLQRAFGIGDIHSEYGMTELLSQAYSQGGGIFTCPPWMRVLVRNEDDPLDIAPAGSGVINVIDLANIHSCVFIATDDIGRLFADGRFEVQGRRDNSDLRGCSLLAT